MSTQPVYEAVDNGGKIPRPVIDTTTELSDILKGRHFEDLDAADISLIDPMRAASLSTDTLARVANIPEHGNEYATKLGTETARYAQILNNQRIAKGELDLYPDKSRPDLDINITAIRQTDLPIEELVIHLGRPITLDQKFKTDAVIIQRINEASPEEIRSWMSTPNIWKVLPLNAREMVNLKANVLPTIKDAGAAAIVKTYSEDYCSTVVTATLNDKLKNATPATLVSLQDPNLANLLPPRIQEVIDMKLNLVPNVLEGGAKIIVGLLADNYCSPGLVETLVLSLEGAGSRTLHALKNGTIWGRIPEQVKLLINQRLQPSS